VKFDRALLRRSGMRYRRSTRPDPQRCVVNPPVKFTPDTPSPMTFNERPSPPPPASRERRFIPACANRRTHRKNVRPSRRQLRGLFNRPPLSSRISTLTLAAFSSFFAPALIQFAFFPRAIPADVSYPAAHSAGKPAPSGGGGTPPTRSLARSSFSPPRPFFCLIIELR